MEQWSHHEVVKRRGWKAARWVNTPSVWSVFLSPVSSYDCLSQLEAREWKDLSMQSTAVMVQSRGALENRWSMPFFIFISILQLCGLGGALSIVTNVDLPITFSPSQWIIQNWAYDLRVPKVALGSGKWNCFLFYFLPLYTWEIYRSYGKGGCLHSLMIIL